jgi:hypothetical protein
LNVEGVDWCAAACADALVEGLTLHALRAAHEGSARTPQEFYWAVEAALKLKEVCDG